jgi:hypothetical protein
METKQNDGRVDYIEFAACEIAATKAFYGPDYTTFEDGRQTGGFAKSDTVVRPFPGGRRFHFTDPSGNEFAVWPDQ